MKRLRKSVGFVILLILFASVLCLHVAAEEEPLAIITQPKDTVAQYGKGCQVMVETNKYDEMYTLMNIECVWYKKYAGEKEFTKCDDEDEVYDGWVHDGYLWFTPRLRHDNMQVYCILTDADGNSLKSDTVTIRLEKNDGIVAKGKWKDKITWSLSADGTLGISGSGAIREFDETSPWYSEEETLPSTYHTEPVLASEIKNVKFHEGITEIGRDVLFDLHISKLYIPKSVKKIGEAGSINSGVGSIDTIVFSGDAPEFWNYGESAYNRFFSADFYSYPKNNPTWTIDLMEWIGGNWYCGDRSAISAELLQDTNAVKDGQTAKVYVEAKGDGLTYTWYYKTAYTKYKKTSEDSSAYTWKMKADEIRRRVVCVISDKNGNQVVKGPTIVCCLKSGHTTVTITSQPETVYAKYGETATVGFTATGRQMVYRWWLVDGNTREFLDFTETPSYSIKMSESVKDKRIYCNLYDDTSVDYYGSLDTKMVYLRMAATITKQPADARAAVGYVAKTALTAVGDGLKYQWYIKNPGASQFSKSSVTSTEYACKMSEDIDGRQVYCVVTDKYGKTDTSGIVTFTVAKPVKITVQPKTTYTKLGEEAKTTVTAEGDGLTYQWYIRAADDTSYTKSAVVTNTYSVTMSSASKDRLAYCIVTDKYNNTVKSSTIRLRMAATVTVQPKNDRNMAGSVVSTEVVAVGDGLSYQWYIKNPGNSSFSKSSVTDSAYSCTITEVNSGRQVYCVVTDKYGKSDTSDIAVLSAAEPVKITVQPKTTYTKQGSTAKTTVTAVGDGLTYQWYIKNVGSTTYGMSSITSSAYSVKMSSTSKDRIVYCVVTDKYGNSIESEKVRLRMAATITTQPKNVSGASGTTVKTTVKAAGDGLTYQWYIKNPGKTAFSKSSITTATYSCKMSASISGRQVYCVVTDKYGKTHKSNTVTLSMS